MDSFRDLIAWTKGMELAKATYLFTQDFPSRELYGLSAQLRRAAVSVPSNVAEGKGRSTDRDYAHFLLTALGSLNELETQSELAFELNYVSAAQRNQLIHLIQEEGRILNGLIKSLRSNVRT